MHTNERPPGMNEADRVILFDGVCVLCSYWARFLVRFDARRRYKLATVQSDEGRAILAWCGLPLDKFDTLVLVEKDAFLCVLPPLFGCLGGFLFRGHWRRWR